MPSSLVPESPILVYPSLAATLGLEESIMLSQFAERIRYMDAQNSQGYDWYQLAVDELLHLLPFWDRRDLQRVCTNLREKGVIIVSSGPIENNDLLRFAFNQRAQEQLASHGTRHRAESTAQTVPQNAPAPTQHAPHSPAAAGQNGGASLRRSNTQNGRYTSQNPIQPSAQTNRSQQNPGYTAQHNSNSPHSQFLSKNYIAPNWQPDETTLGQLAQHNIPRSFALEQAPEFVTYWRERGERHHSWGSKFIQHALRQWRDFETERYKKEQEVPIQHNWKPNHDALEILIDKAGIRPEFIEDAIPEFILYWQERGESHRTWNTKFVQHVRIQWAKFTSAIENNTDPRPIPPDWQPSNDVYDVLRLANIELNFAQTLTPEFVLYWRDRGVLYGSWNTKYLQHVKRMWAQRHTFNDSAQNNRQTRDISLEEQLTDRSWAD